MANFNKDIAQKNLEEIINYYNNDFFKITENKKDINLTYKSNRIIKFFGSDVVFFFPKMKGEEKNDRKNQFKKYLGEKFLRDEGGSTNGIVINNDNYSFEIAKYFLDEIILSGEKEGNMQNLVCIYSVGTNGYGIDEFEGKRGIYIYETSAKNDLENINIGDTIAFFTKNKDECLTFIFKNRNQITEYNGNKYIIIDEESKNTFNISIADFKNLYFLDIDKLKSWVRSPLQYNKNILIFQKETEIIPEFKNIDTFNNALKNYKDFSRKYYFTGEEKEINNLLQGKKDKYQNIVVIIKNDKFEKEYSIFHKDGLNDKNILINFDIPFYKLKDSFKKFGKQRLDKIINNNNYFETISYVIYYELTRTRNDIESNSLKELITDIKNEQVISQEQLYNIFISLTVNNFLIFSGPSGTGKTSIVQKIAESFNGKDQNGKTIGFYKLPIKSNFTDESAILGYWNPLLSRYEGTETLKFLIDIYKSDNEINFLLLDEMNLSKIENYFSTFLSEIDKLKEGKETKILLFETNLDNRNEKQMENFKQFIYNNFYSENDENYYGSFFENNLEKIIDFNGTDYFSFINKDFDEMNDYQGANGNHVKNIKVYLPIKNNLKIIGTINEDETTNSISNKVLDRSQFITFEVENLFGEDKNDFFWFGDEDGLEEDFFTIYKSEKIKQNQIEKYFKKLEKYREIKALINAINSEIQNISINESIGYRAIEEIMTYIKNYCNYKEESSITGLTESLDNQINQKVLTKLKTFSLVSDDSKKAFERIGKILEEPNELKYIDKNGEEQNINLEGKLEKSIKFYKHLKNNLLD